jgi:hypothetical protein
MESEGLLPCAQESATSLYSESNESSPQLHSISVRSILILIDQDTVKSKHHCLTSATSHKKLLNTMSLFTINVDTSQVRFPSETALS